MVAYSAELTMGADGRPCYRAWYQNHYGTWMQAVDARGISICFLRYVDALARAKEAWELSNARWHA